MMVKLTDIISSLVAILIVTMLMTGVMYLLLAFLVWDISWGMKYLWYLRILCVICFFVIITTKGDKK